MKKRIQKLLLISLGLLIINSCTDDYFEFDKINTDEWRPELAIPLVNSKLSLNDIIIKEDKNGIINTDPNTGLLEVVYEGRVFTTNDSLAIDLPNQQFEENFSSPSPLPPTGGTIAQTMPILLDFDIGGSDLEIDSLLLKSGLLKLTVENTFEHNIDIVARYPTILDRQKNPLVVNYSLPASSPSQPIPSVPRETDLTGYTMDMTNGGSTINKIPIVFEITFNLIQGNSSTSNDKLRFVGRIENMDFKRFNGYVGMKDLKLDQDSINVGLFKNFKNGTFFLSNPFMEITVSNSFGMPANMNFNNLEAINPNKTPSSMGIILPPEAKPLPLEFPKKDGVAKKKLELDANNSNIDDVVSFLVKDIAYDATVNVNPNGKTADRNFLTDTSKIGLDVFLRMPFEGFATGFLLRDTIGLGFENSDDIANGIIRVTTENGFPISAEFQVVFVDAEFNPIDSLYINNPGTIGSNDRFVVPPAITSNGVTVANSVATDDSPISSERLKKIAQGEHIILEAVLNTDGASQNNTVKFLDSYRISVSIGLKAAILIE